MIFKLLLSGIFWLHGFHLSQTMIDYNVEESALQISMSITLDDLERALEERTTEKLQLCTPKEHEKGEEFIFQYLQEKMDLVVNGQVADFQWVGKEVNEDLEGVWIYLEVLNVTELTSLKIKNAILTTELEDQKNIVQIKGPNGKQGYFMFQRGKEEDEVVF